MLFELLNALMGESKKEADVKRDVRRKGKPTQKEKDELEYKLWVMAEEYKEEE